MALVKTGGMLSSPRVTGWVLL